MRVPVDFNTMGRDDEGRVWINTRYHPALADALRPGLKVVLYEDGSFEVDAVVEYDPVQGSWLAQPDWSTRRDLIAIDGMDARV